jgi:aminopeptidase C
MEFLNRDPVGDGGQFDMAVNIVEVGQRSEQVAFP